MIFRQMFSCKHSIPPDMKKKHLKITFLGTGTSSGVPMIACDCAVCTSSDTKDKRLRSSILVQSESTHVVIDTTPDFRQQMLRINNKKLDAVVYTHAHKDHIAGLDDVKAYNYFQKKDMLLYADAFTQEELRREFYYAFAENKYPGVPDLILQTVTKNKSFTVGDIDFLPIEVWHYLLPVLAYRIGSFAYITDANRIEEDQLELLKGTETLVVSALRKEKHISHFTLAEAIELVEKLEVKQAYFTHISHQLGLHNEIEKELPSNMHLAYDGLTLYV